MEAIALTENSNRSIVVVEPKATMISPAMETPSPYIHTKFYPGGKTDSGSLPLHA